MKILVLLPYSPVPHQFGGAIRIYYLLKSLAAEHDVTVLTFGTSENLDQFRQQLGKQVKQVYMVAPPLARRYKRISQFFSVFSRHSYSRLYSYSKRMQILINDLLETNDFDVVHCEFPVMGIYETSSDLIRLLDAHNVEYENFRRMWLKSRAPLRKWYYKQEYRKVYNEETAVFKKQDAIMATSNEDIEIIKKDVKNVPAYPVPNGVDTSYFIPSKITPEPFSLVFTGMIGYLPNSDGMIWFLDEIFPRILKQIPQARVYIVGKNPPEALKRRRKKNIIITGFVDDVRPYVWRSSVFIVPLRMGSGTRLKVVEALAMKKPVVSTALGCEGIKLEHGKHILIQDDPILFAEEIIRLLQKEHYGRTLSHNGYKRVTSTYDWSKPGKQMLKVYEGLQVQQV